MASHQEPKSRLVSAGIGALVAFVIGFFIPLVGQIVGGVLAGYFRGNDPKEGALTGALAGVIAGIPAIGVVGLLMLFVVGLGASFGAEGLVISAVIALFFMVTVVAVYAGLAALGGALGGAISDRPAPN